MIDRSPEQTVTTPTEKQLREAAHKNYGRPCTDMLCGGRGDGRMIVLYRDIEAERDETMGGTWIGARLWIPDEACKP